MRFLFFFFLLRLTLRQINGQSEPVTLDYCLAIPSSLRSSLRVPSSSKADVLYRKTLSCSVIRRFLLFRQNRVLPNFPYTNYRSIFNATIYCTASVISCRLFLRLRLVVGAKLFVSIF